MSLSRADEEALSALADYYEAEAAGTGWDEVTIRLETVTSLTAPKRKPE